MILSLSRIMQLYVVQTITKCKIHQCNCINNP